MNRKYTYLIIIFLVVVSCTAFGRIAGNDFILYDDDMFITENNPVKEGINPESIKWAITSTHLSYWHPVTWLSHMLDWQLFGKNASGHHIVSLFLHIGAVIFLFLFFNKTTNNLWPSAFAAALFAMHPLRVESVAWAAERKDVLGMFFGMACLYSYAFYAENAKFARYLLCLILFILALMSKPTMVTLPFVLILLDYWPLQRWQRAMDEQGKMLYSVKGLIWEKAPFIFLTIVISVVTFLAQNKVGATSFGANIPLVTRTANATVSYVSYLEKTFWPFNFALFYPYDVSLPLWKILISAIILTLITVSVLYCIKKRPFLFTGWFWYLGTLIPVIGLVQSGTQAMADRYTYLSSVGIAIMLSWGIFYLIKSENIRKKILFPLSISFIILLAVLTWQQCGYWKNSIEIWNHAVEVTHNNFLAYSRLGNAYGEDKQYQKAIDNFNEVIRIRPDYEIAYNGKGFSYNAMGMYQLAVNEFDKSITLNPHYAAAYNNRAYSYFMQGDKISGCKDAKKACELGVCTTLEAAKGKEYCR